MTKTRAIAPIAGKDFLFATMGALEEGLGRSITATRFREAEPII